ncbi:hypothetical protein T4D_14356 [Trichinella pseudospiralis]|uniref:Uncharacterized protein n=1 Tax=Trichinella pseudospiralis TaxID=6337 RepID=A0A0V1FDY4_TRIPS|nr:hypothetical protein T4D_14356 [Trichinella pseudospiralis]
MTFSYLVIVFLWKLSSILVFKAVAIVVPMIMYNLFCEFFNNSKEKKNPVPRNTDNDGPLVVFFNVALYKAVGKIFPRGRRRITIKCRTTAIRHAVVMFNFIVSLLRGDYQLAFRITSRRERLFLAVVCPIAADQMSRIFTGGEDKAQLPKATFSEIDVARKEIRCNCMVLATDTTTNGYRYRYGCCY